MLPHQRRPGRGETKNLVPRRHQVRLHQVVEHRRALRAVARDLVVAPIRRALRVERADGDRKRRDARRRDAAVDGSPVFGLAEVAGGGDDGDARAVGALDRLAQRVVTPALGDRPAERHVDDFDVEALAIGDAQSMASITSPATPRPFASRTFRLMMFAPGATPSVSSKRLRPAAAMIPATCVPWPFWSMPGPRSSVKSRVAMMRPRNSGMFATPESMTATPMPLPVSGPMPAAQPPSWTRSAPID